LVGSLYGFLRIAYLIFYYGTTLKIPAKAVIELGWKFSRILYEQFLWG